jgi:uracil-DNA glycosylase
LHWEKIAYKSIVASYHLNVLPSHDAVECPEGFQIWENIRLFPVYHCGARGWNITTKRTYAEKDWEKIRKDLDAY